MGDKPRATPSPGPAGGWGSLKSIARIYGTTWSHPGVLDTLRRQNKPGGFMCSSCAWPKPANYRAFEFCENGAKATLWEQTKDRCTPDFWDDHTVTELRAWRDHDLEKTGRLTHPLKYDPATDRYRAIGWDEAIAEIGGMLKGLEPDSVVFYSSGHAGLEASYLYALMARVYGTNNLPQSSNMCHETTSMGLKKVIGSPVGTVVWDDLQAADAFFFFGQNPGSNSPRFLHPLREAKKRGARIVTFNPVIEQGLVSFVSPQDPVEMMTGRETQISDLYLQVKAGGDIAAILGLCKVVVETDDKARAGGGEGVVDHAFVAEHTTGYEDFVATCRSTDWPTIEAESGISEADLRQAARIYLGAERIIGVYGMGVTQHPRGALNIAMIANLLLLRGHVGRRGAGFCPVRGHSNVQGQRTVGVAHKTSMVPLDRLAEQFDFEPPRKDGMAIAEAVEGMSDGRVKACISLGGNLVRAVPEQTVMEEAWPSQELTVMISTKLNRSHLFPGKAAYILPCLSRSEKDEQKTGNQAISVEDSFSMIHGSVGHRDPASPHLKSELEIVAELAKAILPEHPKLSWDAWTDDYSLVRDQIEATYPSDFRDYNRRLHQPGGFHRGNPARERRWNTEAGRAIFTAPDVLNATGFEPREGRFTLITMRSNDQFNTTIYGYSDRFRGIEGTRDVVLMNPVDMEAVGLKEGEAVRLVTDIDDGRHRALGGLTLRRFHMPRGVVGAYYPETNVLVPLGHRDRLSDTPGSKSVPVRVEREAAQAEPARTVEV